MSTKPERADHILGIPREIFLAITEILVAGVIATVAYVTLNDPANKALQAATTTTIAAFGVLHGLHRVMTVFDTNKAYESMKTDLNEIGGELLEKIDDSDSRFLAELDVISRRVGLGELSNMYWQIEREFDHDRELIISGAKRQLDELLSSKKSSVMTKAPYYNWISTNIVRVNRGGRIVAISKMEGIEWDDTPEERNFFAQNVAVANAGGTVDRIFVMPKKDFEKVLQTQPNKDENVVDAVRVVRAHSDNGIPRMNGWFADLDRIKEQDSKLLERIGDGFLLMQYRSAGDRVALIDDFGDQNEARGYVSKDDSKLNELLRLFDDLQALSGEIKL